MQLAAKINKNHFRWQFLRLAAKINQKTTFVVIFAILRVIQKIFFRNFEVSSHIKYKMFFSNMSPLLFANSNNTQFIHANEHIFVNHLNKFLLSKVFCSILGAFIHHLFAFYFVNVWEMPSTYTYPGKHQRYHLTHTCAKINGSN